MEDQMTKRILIVDYDKNLYTRIQSLISNKGYIIIFRHANNVMKIHEVKNHDLLVIGTKPSFAVGWLKMKKSAQIPIFLLTDTFEATEMLIALSWDVDDYAAKTAKDIEWLLRIKRLLRSERTSTFTESQQSAESICIGNLTIRPLAREVQIKHQRMECTPKEFALLTFFAQHPNKVVSRQELLQELWGKSYEGSVRTIDTHIKELRRKLNTLSFEDAKIVTVWGNGYKFALGDGNHSSHYIH
jgi:DNA-binding response OmpR family regulator